MYVYIARNFICAFSFRLHLSHLKIGGAMHAGYSILGHINDLRMILFLHILESGRLFPFMQVVILHAFRERTFYM